MCVGAKDLADDRDFDNELLSVDDTFQIWRQLCLVSNTPHVLAATHMILSFNNYQAGVSDSIYASICLR